MEERRWKNRVSKLTMAGVPLEDAEYVASQMMLRDRPDSGDGRRICFECRHLRKDRYCFVYADGVREPLRATLQNCLQFELIRNKR